MWEDKLNLEIPENRRSLRALKGRNWSRARARKEISAAYEKNRQEAIAADVLGSPVYGRNGEVFWGQHRIELLADALKSGRKPYSSQV